MLEQGTISRERPLTSREVVAQRIAERLDLPVTILGVATLVLWLTEPVIDPDETSPVVDAAWWVIWVIFAIEFVARAVVAPRTWLFLRRHWWEVIFLLVPFLRFARVLRAARAGRGVKIGRLIRAGPGLSSALRSTRSAVGALVDRLFWLTGITVLVAAAAGKLLWDYGERKYKASYLDALHDGALATIKGESLPSHDFADGLELALALYSVLIIAVVASTVGAFFVERGMAREPRLP